MDKLMSICTHAYSDSSVTMSISVNPMFAPDDVFIPVTMRTMINDMDEICQKCGDPYVTKR